MKKQKCNHLVQPLLAISGRLIATLFWISSCHSSSNKNFHLVESAPHLYTDSFPTNDEYDFTILDPNHLYGSPYGGFGRATPSRIAALPLKLPNVAVDLENYEEFRFHVETRDYLGRRFACRTYHEDELETESLEDSMYDIVQLREDTPTPTSAEETITETDTKEVDSATARQAETTAGETRTTDGSSGDECAATAQASKEDGVGSEGVPEGSNRFIGGINDNKINNNNNQVVTATSPESLKVKLVAEVNRRLGKLDGICAQIHEGWWSYEWCHQNLVLQFHVHVGSDATQISEIKLLDETKLGKWSHREIQVTKDSPFFDSIFKADDDAPDPEDGSLASSEPMVGSEEETTNSQDTVVLNMLSTSKPKAKPLPNKYSEGTPELAVVSDVYSNGDICPDTGKPRTTQVDLRCCSPRVMNRIKGGVLYKGQPIKNDMVAIHSLSEQPGSVCVYNVTVCTPLLCSDEESQMSLFGNAGGLSGTSSRTSTSTSTNTQSERAISALGIANVNVEHMSVREILDLTFGKALKTCIQSNTGGWWIYEICPGTLVRQFHETTLMDRVSGASSTAVDTEHILGKYNADGHESYPNESEWQLVVNATVLGGGTIPSLPTAYGGNGAYYYQEYSGGDVCDHTDVTEAAIKAGAVGEGGVERASTVRYSCGTRMSLNVKEDSTCHYLVEVTIPALCDHPLFRPPVSKRQILKCLPAEDSLGTLEDWYA